MNSLGYSINMMLLSVLRRFICLLGVVWVPWLPASEIESVVDELVEEVILPQGPGVAVLVDLPGEETFTKGYGLANLSTEAPIDEESLFDLASVSKPITALTILALVEAGRFSLDTAVAELIEEFQVPQRGRPITIRDLLQHTSGLPDYSKDFSDDDEELARLTTETHVDWLNENETTGAPGRTFSYNNSNYSLLARVAEVVEGKSFAEVVEEWVFQPAGTQDTFVYDGTRPRLPKSAVKGYAVEGEEATPSEYLTDITGDGNVYSNVTDLARLMQALGDGEIVSAELLREAWAPGEFDNGSPIEDDGSSYGLGWEVFPDGPQVGHAGSWYGTSTYLLFNPETNQTIAVLSNDENLRAEDLAWDIARALE